MSYKKFEKGDFIRMVGNAEHFYIFEGLDQTSDFGAASYWKKYSVIAHYDPSKFVRRDDGQWTNEPFLEIAYENSPCLATLDTDAENYQYSIMTQEEKDAAISILQKNGYDWDDEQHALVKLESREVIKKIKMPKISYEGEIIMPRSKEMYDMLHKSCVDKSKESSYQYRNYGYNGGYCGAGGQYPRDYDYNEYWD